MSRARFWASLTLVGLMVVPAIVVTQQSAFAARAPKAEWRASTATKAKAAPKTKSTAPSAPATPTATEAVQSPQAAVLAPPVVDQSQEVLDIDFAMAASIATQGPKQGYSSALSDEGVLYDANGASPAGAEAATSRFGTFPADVLLVRIPERALAAGGSGSSWGTYKIQRGDTVLSGGRYISVWRREPSGWKMISELAAGKTVVAASTVPPLGVLPKRPPQIGRAPPPPVGVPLTVSVPIPQTPSSATAEPAGVTPPETSPETPPETRPAGVPPAR